MLITPKTIINIVAASVNYTRNSSFILPNIRVGKDITKTIELIKAVKLIKIIELAKAIELAI